MRPACKRLLALTVTLAAGCAPPTDRASRVGTAEAPMLAEGENDAPPMTLLHAGDLVSIGRTARQKLEWHGFIEGQPIARSGDLLEAHRSGVEGGGFVFRGDLSGEVNAVT